MIKNDEKKKKKKETEFDKKFKEQVNSVQKMLENYNKSKKESKE